MAELRRKGLPLAEVGARFELSERSARRYVGKVEPRLRLPRADRDRSQDEDDPQGFRENLVRQFLEWIWRSKKLNGVGPVSVLFINEAERLIRKRLDSLSPIALGFLSQDKGSQVRLLVEAVGSLSSDYVSYHELMQRVFGESGYDWRPSGECPTVEDDCL